MTNTIADALRAAIDLLSATRETFAAEVMLRQYDDVLGKLRAALQAAERNAEMLEAARELLALKEELEHPQPPSTQAEPVAWRITDGEGGYDYRDDPPEDWQVAWVARWGRKHEPLYTQPHPQPPSAQADAIEALRRLVSAIIDDDGGDDDGNAPGHAHKTPGVWDDDNRAGIAGKQCELCAAWNHARAVLAETSR